MQPKKIMWLSPMCSLDRRGGAAQQIRSVLSTLASAGWQAYAVQMTLFDGKEDYPVSTLVGSKYAVPENVGKTLKLEQDGVQHLLFYTQSSCKRTQEESRAFFQRAVKALHEIKPDVFITYGSSKLLQSLVREARKVCRTLIFYLANPSYTDPELFRPFDQVLVPSNFQSQYYQEKLGIKSDVLRTLLPETHAIQPEHTLARQNPQQRKNGLITFINPSPEKGATLFARLVLTAEKERPDLTFLAVEGRMNNDQWREAGLDLANSSNVWWIPNQQDVRRIYSRTSILLFPSFWNEASGRSIAEAQLGGIPVLGSNHAGIPEQLNGGGFLFDIPQKCREKYSVVPGVEEVRPWLKTIYKLMDDEDFYREATDRALKCGAMFSREVVQKDVIERFEAFAEGKNLQPPLEAGQVVKTKKQVPIVKSKKVGRNDPCPCGSGEKAKNCCGTEGPPPDKMPVDIESLKRESSTREPTQEEVKREIKMFQNSLGYEPDLAHPQTFNEKIARRKLFGELPDAAYLADKLQVREMVENRAGESVLPQLHKAIASTQEMNLEELPDDFTIMASHFNAQRIVQGKEQNQIPQYCTKLLQTVHGQKTNEYWFTQIPPRILFAQLLKDAVEYKLFVFHGKCQFIQTDRKQQNGPARTIYNPKWEVQPVCIKLAQGQPEDKPENLEQMIEAAEKIAQGYDFLRVDLFTLNGQVLFNTITLAPGAGWERFSNPDNPQKSYEVDQWFGSFW
ncbi:MAG: ATP-grasp fold amidoligase family protein [Thermodesulfobacteriota bacterium]